MKLVLTTYDDTGNARVVLDDIDLTDNSCGLPRGLVALNTEDFPDSPDLMIALGLGESTGDVLKAHGNIFPIFKTTFVETTEIEI